MQNSNGPIQILSMIVGRKTEDTCHNNARIDLVRRFISKELVFVHGTANCHLGRGSLLGGGFVPEVSTYGGKYKTTVEA